jgi:hypothetical protein
MKELLLQIFQKEIEYFNFNQDIYVYPKQFRDSGEIYETEVDSYEPSYAIHFKDGSEIIISLSELIVKIFNLK